MEILVGFGGIAVGIAFSVGLMYFFRKAYLKGARDRDSLYARLYSPTPGPEDLYEAVGDLTSTHDIVFDADVATYLASGVYSRQWPEIMRSIHTAVTGFVKDCPPEHNTVLVRAIKLDGKGQLSYSFESLFNSGLAKEE